MGHKSLRNLNNSLNTNKTNACLICHEKHLHYNFSLDKFRVEECPGCGLMRINPQPTDDELAAIYGKNYFLFSNHLEEKQHASILKSLTADHYLNLLETYQGTQLKGRLLEIGCGQGDFLVKAAERGLHVTGVEYSQHSVDIATKKLGEKGKIYCGEINQILELNEHFDIIVFADVLEHVRDPRDFLTKVHALLAKDGIVVIAVPTLDSFSARFMKSRWVEFKPEHLWYLSTKTLTRLLHSESFAEIKIKPAKKFLSFDYIAEHFEHYPVKIYTPLIRLIKKILPHFIRRYPLHITASGIIAFAKKQELHASKKLSVLMAVYNEAGSVNAAIQNVLDKKIADIEIELIIIESNSTDGTREIVLKYENYKNVKIVLQDKACGKGNAIRAGLQHISGDYVLIQDADSEYDIEDYDALIEPLASGKAAFVLGARHGGKTWKMRQFQDQRLAGHFLNFGHWFFTTLVNIVYGLRLKDPFTMYKVFRSDCLRGIHFECNRFDFDYELLIKLVRNGYKPIEIPVNYRSRSFKQGKKVRIFRDPLTWFMAIIKFRFKRI